MLEIIFSLIGGFVFGYGIQEITKIMQERGIFKGFKMIKEARKKGKKVFLCETKNAFWVKQEKESYQNLSLTPEREIIIVSPNSVKPCYGLGGTMLGVADLYRACSIPQELRQTIVFLKLIGLKDKDIKEYLTKIHGIKNQNNGDVKSAVEDAEEFLEEKIDELIDEAEEKGNKDRKKMLELIKENKEFYLTTPSTIVEFLQTGINRVTLKQQIRQIIDEKLLERLGKPDWFGIGLAIFLILIGLWFFFGGGFSGLMNVFGGGPTIPPR